ncbi:MAG: hypothetical protein P8X74_19665, partial [Reinekea sp.]
ELCAKKASELGIKNIYYVDPYPGLASSHNLKYTTSPELKQFYGAVGMGFYRLYMPLLPMKEELYFLGAKKRNDEQQTKQDSHSQTKQDSHFSTLIRRVRNCISSGCRRLGDWLMDLIKR